MIVVGSVEINALAKRETRRLAVFAPQAIVLPGVYVTETISMDRVSSSISNLGTAWKGGEIRAQIKSVRGGNFNTAPAERHKVREIDGRISRMEDSPINVQSWDEDPIKLGHHAVDAPVAPCKACHHMVGKVVDGRDTDPLARMGGAGNDDGRLLHSIRMRRSNLERGNLAALEALANVQQLNVCREERMH